MLALPDAASRKGRAQGGLEARESVDRGRPLGDVAVGVDKPADSGGDLLEGDADLHEAAELDGAREELREREEDGHELRHLAKAHGEEREVSLPVHERAPVADNALERSPEPRLLGLLGAQARNRLAVAADVEERGAEVGLPPLLLEVELHQGTADHVREPRRDERVADAGPDHVAGKRPLGAEHRPLERARQRPEDGDEAHDGEERAQEGDDERERRFDQEPHVLGDSLVGVVGLKARELQAVVAAVGGEPAAEQVLGHPAAPLDHELLAQPVRIDEDEHEGRDDRDEFQKKRVDRPAVHGLNGIEEGAVPGVEAHGEPDGRERQADDGQKQQASARAPCALHPEGTHEPPEGLELMHGTCIEVRSGPGGGVVRRPAGSGFE